MDRMDSKERVAPRITILDAKEYDNAIYDVMNTQKNIITNYIPSWILNKYEPELDALMKLAIWQLSVGKNKASFGQQLLHLKYSNESRLSNLKILAILTIGVPYVKERLQLSSNSGVGGTLKNVDNVLEKTETFLKILNILILMRFLWKGGPSTFLEWILSLTPISTIPQAQRSVGYSYMTRELIWHGFIELLVIVLPLLSYHQIKRKFLKLFSGRTSLNIPRQKCVFTPATICEICREPPILPNGMGCIHVFCYSCLSANRRADANFECPSCGYSNPNPDAVAPVQNLLMPSFASKSNQDIVEEDF